MNQSRTIRLPVHVVKELNIVLRARRQLESHGGARADGRGRRAPARPARGGAPGAGAQRAHRLARRAARHRSDAVDRRVHCRRQHASPEPQLEHARDRGAGREWVGQLTDKQRLVIERRYGLNGQRCGPSSSSPTTLELTRERVRQIQLEALPSFAADPQAPRSVEGRVSVTGVPPRLRGSAVRPGMRQRAPSTSPRRPGARRCRSEGGRRAR